MHDEKNEFGLPLEYKKLPEFFDAHNITNKTETTNRFLEKLLSKIQQWPGVKRTETQLILSTYK